MSAQQPHIPSTDFPHSTQPEKLGSDPPIPSARLPAPPAAAGQRIALSTDTPFPSPSTLPPSSLHDRGGPHQLVYVGSALFGLSVHPCKIAPHLNPPVRVGYDGDEHDHWGQFDLLPINHQTMDWVPTSHGRIPLGRRPVEGGYEENGARLFHAIAYIDNIWVPGKTGEHIVRKDLPAILCYLTRHANQEAAKIPYGGKEMICENYQILCWRTWSV